MLRRERAELWLGILAVCASHNRIGALRVREVKLDTISPWVFAERFVFVAAPEEGGEEEAASSGKHGELAYRVTSWGGASPGAELLLYHDGFERWVDLYESGKSCAEKRDAASAVISLGGERKGRATVRNDVDLWVFAVFANCDEAGQGPLVLEYDLHLTNGGSEFSADEAGVLQASIAFLVAYVCLAVCCRLMRRRLAERRQLHPTVDILCLSIAAQLAGCAGATVHYSRFAADGVGAPATRATADFLWATADLVLLLDLILLAKGWTIVRHKISIAGRVKVALFFTVLGWTTLCVELWAYFVFDRATEAYKYESPPGLLLVALRALALAWFWYAAATTARQFCRKRHFYRKFNACFTAWLVAKPLFVIVALFLDDSHRQLVVYVTELALALLAHATLTYMYLPGAKFNKGFPFHAASDPHHSLGSSRLLDGRTKRTMLDEDDGIDLDTGTPIRRRLRRDDDLALLVRGSPDDTLVTRKTVFRRISVAAGKTARLMRAMAQISTDLDRALLDLQGEIECDLDVDTCS